MKVQVSAQKATSSEELIDVFMEVRHRIPAAVRKRFIHGSLDVEKKRFVGEGMEMVFEDGGNVVIKKS